ncbi:MAG TPA: hypothetical protein VJ754_06180 [Anaerolineae bacterium]|nr:hypothetical protein [Anaerolineae bacterium]
MKAQHTRLVPLMRVALIVSLAAVTGTGVYVLAARQQSDAAYFSETGHNVKGEFLRFFRQKGELEMFGYPITEEFVEDGRLVQYFQRGRLELHPENAPEYRVQLGLLAELMGKREPPIDPLSIPLPHDPDRRYFPETGHVVAFSFLSFFDAKGGVDIFGYPITEYAPENGRNVQYFQRARMEYYQDLPAQQRVKLTDLGEIYFDWAGLDPSLRRSAPARLDTGTPVPQLAVTSLRLDASVADPYTAYPGQQTVYVYVTDQRKRPVEGARIAFEVEYPDHPARFDMPLTDANGYASLTFDLEQSPIGRTVVVRISATVGAVAGTTQTSFTFWQ